MKDQIRDYAKKLLQDGTVDGFLALRRDGEHIHPHLFTQAQELDSLSLGDLEKPGQARYPLIKVLLRLTRLQPTQKLAVMVRGCEERAFHKLVQASQINPNRVSLVGFSCSQDLAHRCGCLKPWPDQLVAGEKPDVAPSPKVVTATPKNLIKDMQFLKEHFQRCIKCYGCRNICPVCFCHECTLEEETFVPKTGSTLPPANPEFLFTRAVHMVGYCVYCGLCEEACPAHIPLKIVYKMVANIMDEKHGYRIQDFPGRGQSAPAPDDASNA
jgi:ferredoxin